MAVVTLGDAVELAYGKGLPARARRNGSIPVYGSNGVVGSHDEALVLEPTVIVGRKGSVGAVHLASGPSFPIDTTYFVRPKPGVEIDICYASYALKHMDLSRLRTETGVPGLNREDAYREPFSLPSLDEQRRIVDILNRAARIEALRRRAAERLREFVPALFVRMFGDPMDNRNGWDVCRLGDAIRRFEGGRNILAGHGATRFRVLKVSAVTDGIFNPLMSKPVPDGYVPPDDHLVRTGDLLISRANTSNLVGATAMVEHAPPNVLLPDKIWRFVWREDSPIEPVYVDSLFKQASVRAALSRMATGTSGSMKNISQSKLKALPLPLPPLALQRRYAETVEAARAVARVAESSTTVAAILMASLTSELLGNHVSARGAGRA